MIKCVEQFGAEFQTHTLSHAEEFAQRKVSCRFSRSFQSVLAGISKTSLWAIGNGEVVHVEPQGRRGICEVTVADLIRSLQTRRACVAGVKIDLRRERETRAQSNDSAQVPTAEHRIDYAAVITQE